MFEGNACIDEVKNANADRPKLLIVEDDPDVARMLQDHLEYSLSAESRVADSADEAIRLDMEEPCELILIDYLLPDMDGAEVARRLNEEHPRPVIFITGHATLGRAINALRCGAVDMFVKPFDLELLTGKVSAAIETYRRQQRRLRRLERTRRLTKHVIRERRQMRRKLDLVCRDLVNAYRELAVKTSQLFGSGSGSQE